MHKLRVGLIFGGQSAEHQISLLSAQNVIKALDKNKYEVLLIGIDHQGRWLYHQDAQDYIAQENDTVTISLNPNEPEICLLPNRHKSGAQLYPLAEKALTNKTIDVAFPLIHGTTGEDGTIQGVLKLANIPCVGPSVMNAALTMDKDMTKRILRDAGLPIADYCVFYKHQINQINDKAIEDKLGFPCFVKPANTGSSIGIGKASNSKELQHAIEEAFRFDRKILIEKFILGREIECAVLGNDDPKVSVPGEISTDHEFYSYDAKYIQTEGLVLDIPAKITPAQTQQVQELAIQAFKALDGLGMARVDFFLSSQGQFYLNEVNTVPGFTQVSMYPSLWQASGLSYSELLDKLIELALERHQENLSIETHVKEKVAQ